MVTDAVSSAIRGRSKDRGGTERARFTLTCVDVILARPWRKERERERDRSVC